LLNESFIDPASERANISYKVIWFITLLNWKFKPVLLGSTTQLFLSLLFLSIFTFLYYSHFLSLLKEINGK
jgi:hypothetical protein